jgi:hypothetical protein
MRWSADYNLTQVWENSEFKERCGAWVEHPGVSPRRGHIRPAERPLYDSAAHTAGDAKRTLGVAAKVMTRLGEEQKGERGCAFA